MTLKLKSLMCFSGIVLITCLTFPLSAQTIPQHTMDNHHDQVLLILTDQTLSDTARDAQLNALTTALDNRFAQVSAAAEIGLIALENGRTDIAQAQLLALNLGDMLPQGAQAFAAYESKGLPYHAFAEYDSRSETDQRYILPQRVTDLFIACLANDTCRANDFFTHQLDKKALQLGLYYSPAFKKLPEPQNENDTALTHTLKQIFARSDCDKSSQYERILYWVMTWDKPITSPKKLDLLHPWATDLPFPETYVDQRRFAILVTLSANNPQATALRGALINNILTWKSQLASARYNTQALKRITRWEARLALP